MTSSPFWEKIVELLKKPELGFVLDSGSGEKLVTGQKAPFHIRLKHDGVAAHGSKPWLGINSAENLSRCVLKIVDSINKKNNEETSACLTKISGGATTNQVPDRAEAVIDIRIKNRSELRWIEGKIETICLENGCVWERIDVPMFFETDPNNKWIKKFASLGKGIGIESGASDARFLWEKWRIPIIITSARGGGAHGKDEWVDLKSLEKLFDKVINFCRLY